MSESKNTAEFYKETLPKSGLIAGLLILFIVVLIAVTYFTSMYYGSTMSDEMTKKELQIRPNKQLQALHIEESEKLNQPIAWKDKTKTKVKVPIDLAMKAIAKKYAN